MSNIIATITTKYSNDNNLFDEIINSCHTGIITNFSDSSADLLISINDQIIDYNDIKDIKLIKYVDNTINKKISLKDWKKINSQLSQFGITVSR